MANFRVMHDCFVAIVNLIAMVNAMKDNAKAEEVYRWAKSGRAVCAAQLKASAAQHKSLNRSRRR